MFTVQTPLQLQATACASSAKPYKTDMSAEPNTCALFFVLNARMGAGDGASL